MDKNMFFFPCSACYSKLVGDVSEIGRTRICTQCQQQTLVPSPPKRIPPFAEVVRTARHKIATICPYCSNVQKIISKHMGRKIYCSRCHMIIEVPAAKPNHISLSLSEEKVKANGKNVVVVNAKVTDKNDIAIPGAKVTVCIERASGRIIEVSELSNDDGTVSIGYTTGVYSGTTLIKATVADNKDIFSKIFLEEVDGIADGKIIYDSFELFPCEEGYQEVQGELELRNAGKETVLVSKVCIEGNDSVLWETIEPKEINGKEKLTLSFLIPEKMAHSGAITIKTYFSPEDRAQQVVTKDVDYTLEVKSKLHFNIAVPDKIEAGVPFRISLTAKRAGVIDNNFNKELPLSFEFQAISAPDGSMPSFPEEEDVSFFNGLGHSSLEFCSFGHQKNAIIKIFLNGDLRGTLEDIVIFPKQDPHFRIELTSPQVNKQKLTGENTIEVRDEYSNLITDFSEPIFISIDNGHLKKDAKKIATSVQAVEGKVNLTSQDIIIDIDEQLPANSNFVCQYKDKTVVHPLLIHPLPSTVEICDAQISTPINEGYPSKLKIDFTKEGDTSFEVSYVKSRWCLGENFAQQSCHFYFDE